MIYVSCKKAFHRLCNIWGMGIKEMPRYNHQKHIPNLLLCIYWKRTFSENMFFARFMKLKSYFMFFDNKLNLCPTIFATYRKKVLIPKWTIFDLRNCLGRLATLPYVWKNIIKMNGICLVTRIFTKHSQNDIQTCQM